MFNSPYGLYSPDTYWMLQQQMQQMPYMPYSPNFTGGMAPVTTPVVSPPKTRAEQAAAIDEELQKAYALKKELESVVEVEYNGEVTQVAKEQYDEKTGYIAVDGKNDGKIGGWEKVKNFGKGILNLFTDMVCDKNGKPSVGKIATTVVVGGVLAAVGFLFPPAGAAMLAVGGAMAAGTLGVGAYKAATAKTDEEAEKAWQNIGSGTTQLVLTLIGAKGMGNAAAAKAGVAAPKWYRPDQAIKLSWNTGRQAQAAAGGVWKYAKGASAELWNTAKVKFITDKAHYGEKYNNQIKALDDQIAATTDNRYKHILEYTKKCYEGVRNAADDEALRIANAKMEGASKVLQRYVNDNAGTASDDALVAMKEMLEISKSCVARNARTIAAATPIDDVAMVTKDLADDIARLESNQSLTAVDAEKLRRLKDLETAYKNLYNAASPDAEKSALEALAQVYHDTLLENTRVRGLAGTSKETMKAYNDIATMVDQRVSGADIVLKARVKDLKNAQAIIANKEAYTPTEVSNAKSLINRFKPGLVSDKQYMDAVDDLTKSVAGIGERIGNWFSTKKTNSLNAVKGGFGKAKRLSTRPEFLTTTSVARCFTPQTTWGDYAPMVTQGTERLQQLEQVNAYIKQLQQMQNTLNNGGTINLQM